MCDKEIYLDKNQNNKINKLKIFKSASLTFYSNQFGYLMCEEFRYKEKKVLLHTIGGKVENYDDDIFSTAIREFIEETNLELHPIINSLNKNIYELTWILSDILYKTSYFIDICVNKEYNFYHRYFMIILEDIKDLNFAKSIIELPYYFNGNYTTEINKIIWYNPNNPNNPNNQNNISWLTKMFFNLVIKKV